MHWHREHVPFARRSRLGMAHDTSSLYNILSMSWDIPSCERCECQTLFEDARSFGGGRAYAVAWLCPECKKRSLDICLVGPDIPGPGVCLNCGAESLTGPCGECGGDRAEIESRVAEVSAGYPSLVQSAAVSGRRGLIRLAFNMLDIRLSSEPLDAAAWEAKGKLLHRVGLAARGVSLLEQALQAGASAAVEFSLGCALAAEQRHQDAADAFQRYLDQQPDGEHVCAALSNLGSSLAEVGQFAAAEKAHRRAIKRDPSCMRLRLNYYETLRRRRYFDEALEVLNDALRCARPTEKSDVLCMRADTLCELERGMLALRNIDAALKDAPNNPTCHYVRGRALGLLGELHNAKKAMERVLQLAPLHQAAQRALQEIDDALAGRPARKKSDSPRENNTMRAASQPPSSTDMLAMLVLKDEISIEAKILAGELIALRLQVDRWFLLRKGRPGDFSWEKTTSLLEMVERVDRLIEEAWNSARETKGSEAKKIEELLSNSRNELRAVALPD